MLMSIPYFNISTNLIGQHTEGFLKKCDADKKTGFLKGEVATRLAAAGSSVGVALTGVADTFIGLGCSLGAIAALGRSERANLYMSNHLQSCTRLIARPFKYVVQTLNPQAKFTSKATISSKGDGLITHYVKKTLGEALKTCNKSDYWVMRQVVSRLTVALRTVATIITRVVDFAIGLVAGLFALLACGQCEFLNNTALRGLQITGIVTDIMESFVQLLNPEADVRPGFYDNLGRVHYLNPEG